MLFESMVFGGPLNGQMYRYCTWEEAEHGHKFLLAESISRGESAVMDLRAAMERIKV